MTSDLTIAGVEAIYLRLPQVKEQCDSGQDALIVRVTTDAGIVGYGEVDSNPMGAKGVIEGPFSHTTATGLGWVVIGEDPFRTEYLWQKMYRANIYGGRRGVGLHAISGIDMALWDIKGKALGQPVWKLLGGGFTNSLRPYASSLLAPRPRRPASVPGGLSGRVSPPSSSAGTRWVSPRRSTSPWSERPARGWATRPT
jgi:L-rhamnonate dehydratase